MNIKAARRAKRCLPAENKKEKRRFLTANKFDCSLVSHGISHSCHSSLVPFTLCLLSLSVFVWQALSRDIVHQSWYYLVRICPFFLMDQYTGTGIHARCDTEWTLSKQTIEKSIPDSLIETFNVNLCHTDIGSLERTQWISIYEYCTHTFISRPYSEIVLHLHVSNSLHALHPCAKHSSLPTRST